MCGIAGLKPTYGRISQYGTVPGTGAYSCNHTGTLAKTVADTAIILSAVAGHDPKDPLSAQQPVGKYTENLGKNVKGLKVGILRGYFEEVMATGAQAGFLRRSRCAQKARAGDGRGHDSRHGSDPGSQGLHESRRKRFGSRS